MGYKLVGREYNESSLLNLIIMISPNPLTPNPVPTNPVVPNPVNTNPLPVMPSPVIPTATPNVPVTPPRRKSNIFLIFFLVIVLTLVIGILAGYYLSSTNTIPDINIPGVTQTPEVTPTVTIEDPTPSVDPNNPTATPGPIELSKNYETTVLPWEYSFKYPSTWTSNQISTQAGSLSISFAKDHTGCAQGEVICSLVFAVNVAAEMVDSAVATPLSTEEIVIQNEGPVRITLYQYVNNGNHFYMIPIRNGWIMANVASGKDDEAGVLFKQILGSYISEESPDAL